MNIGLCDDEHTFLTQLSELVADYGRQHRLSFRITCFARGEELLAAIQDGQDFDLLFLDIFMGTSDGINVARQIRELGKTCSIVFATSSRDHAISGYEVRAIHYLLKPLDAKGVTAALDRVLAEQPPKPDKVIQVQNRQGSYRIGLGELLYAESNARVLSLHTTTQGCIEFYERLDNFELQCGDPRFLRCHKSFLVNLDFVRACTNNAFVLEAGQEIRISMRISEAKERFAAHKASRI